MLSERYEYGRYREMSNYASLSKRRGMCISDYMQIALFYLGRLADDQCSSIVKGSILSTISNIMLWTLCSYNLLPWQWIDRKLHIEWKYLLCFIFADAAFLLGTAELLVRTIANGDEYCTITSSINPLIAMARYGLSRYQCLLLYGYVWSYIHRKIR